MYKSLYISAVGSIMQERKMDMIANNISNVNNSGFKRDFPVFESVKQTSNGISDTAFLSIPMQATDYLQGSLVETGDPFDVAIEGEGFFAIQKDGETFYTRKGDFTLNKEGNIVTHEGDIVLGSTIPKGATISIDAKGKVSAKVKGKSSIVGTIKIVNMSKPYNLRKVGNGLFQAIGEVEEEATNFKNTSIRQGFIEDSNVSAVNELVSMITASRAYESYSKVMKAIDEINGRAVSEIARVA